MRSFLKSIASALIVVGVGSFPVVSRASYVTFYTTGVFSGTDATAGGASLTKQLTTGAGPTAVTEKQILTYNPAATVVNLDDYNGGLGAIAVVLGTFNLEFDYNRANKGLSLFLLPLDGSDQFTLTIWQVLPGNTTGVAVASVTSTIKQNGGQDAVIDFSPNPVTILNETYSLPDPLAISHNLVPTGISNPAAKTADTQLSHNDLTADINGPAVAPLPQTASLGLGMLGSLGLVFGLKRSRKSISAA